MNQNTENQKNTAKKPERSGKRELRDRGGAVLLAGTLLGLFLCTALLIGLMGCPRADVPGKDAETGEETKNGNGPDTETAGTGTDETEPLPPRHEENESAYVENVETESEQNLILDSSVYLDPRPKDPGARDAVWERTDGKGGTP